MKDEIETVMNRFALEMSKKDIDIEYLKGEIKMRNQMKRCNNVSMADEDWGFFLMFLAVIVGIVLVLFMVKVSADRQVAHNLNRIATVIEQNK